MAGTGEQRTQKKRERETSRFRAQEKCKIPSGLHTVARLSSAYPDPRVLPLWRTWRAFRNEGPHPITTIATHWKVGIGVGYLLYQQPPNITWAGSCHPSHGHGASTGMLSNPYQNTARLLAAREHAMRPSLSLHNLNLTTRRVLFCTQHHHHSRAAFLSGHILPLPLVYIHTYIYRYIFMGIVAGET